MRERVAILGASNKPDRYAYRALRALANQGHDVILISPAVAEIDGRPVVASLDRVSGPLDTLTVYVNARVSSELESAIVRARPGRVIFNPGAENTALAGALDRAGIAHEDACTLVLLATGQF